MLRQIAQVLEVYNVLLKLHKREKVLTSVIHCGTGSADRFEQKAETFDWIIGLCENK